MVRRGAGLVGRNLPLHRLDNPAAAAQVIDGIYEKAQMLTRHPDIGTRLRQVEEGDVRFMLYGHYASPICGTPAMN